ncbi:MAG: site-specific integrase [Alteromonadaceae bacterium]
MIDYSSETLIFDNGERYPILMGSDQMPHFYTTLWVTTKLRSKTTSAQTISNKLSHVKWFFSWMKNEQRDLYKEFQKGEFLCEEDIENIKSHLAIDIQQSKDRKNKASKGRNKVINIIDTPKLVDVIPSVGRDHHYNRMTSVIEYLTFLAKLAVKNIVNPRFNREIKKMEKEFKAARPKGKGRNVLDETDDKTLPEDLVKEFMAVAHYDNPINPFTQKAVRFRNHLMFHLMDRHGIRSGEMLSLTLTDMTLHGNKKSFWVRRTHDDKNDPRKKQPVAKTRERKLRISDETAELLSRYISMYRAKTPNAKKHAYLFVVNRKGATQGNPISRSTFDNTIVPAMKKVDEKFVDIHPHYFRHDWNEGFSEKVDNNNKLAASGADGYTHIDSGKEAKMRKHQMGHSSEKSGNTYNKRHVSKKANEISLMDQEELNRKASQVRNESGSQGGSNG